MYRFNKLFTGTIWFVVALTVFLAGAFWMAREFELFTTSQNFQAQAQDLTDADDSLIDPISSTEPEEEILPLDELAASRDARAVLVTNFIERNDPGGKSPLQPYDQYGQLFVDIADEYGLDFRLLPALARKESSFCASNIGRTYFNCFGYGVPSSGITDAGKFTSYEEGFRTVAASLKRNYIDKGLTDPIAIMQKYNPVSAQGDGSWAAHLNQWMTEMRYDDKKAGVEKTTNIDLTEFVEETAD